MIELDGTVRLSISNRSHFPGGCCQRIANARPDRRSVAGMRFVDDAGTENGGLIQHRKLNASVATRTGVIVNDRPDPQRFSIHDLKVAIAQTESLPVAEREARFAALRDEGKVGEPRVYLGTTRHRGFALMLSDAKGRARLLLLVPAQGEPVLQLLAEHSLRVVTTCLWPP